MTATADTLLREVAAAGGSLRIRDGRPEWEGPRGALTPDLRRRLETGREDLLRVLPGETPGQAMDAPRPERQTADAKEPWEPPVPFDAMDLPAFPADVLPGWLRAWVEAEAEATQTPADLGGMLALSVCAAAVARKAVVRVNAGHAEPLNIFTVTALPPGNRKSAVFADAVRPLEEYEAAETQRTAPEIAEAEAQRKIVESSKEKAETAAANAKAEERAVRTAEAVERARELAAMTVPTAPRLLADDASPERLATLLRDQGGRMAVMSPEGDVFDLMAGRYSASGGPNFGVYLKGHAGDNLRVDRVGRPAEFVKAPALTLGLAVQPDVLRGLMDKPGFRGRGLLGRFLYALPVSLLGWRITNPAPVPAEVRAAYERGVLALLAMPTGTDLDGNPAPHVLRLDDAAQSELLAFAAWIEPQLAEHGELGSMTDWAGKLAGAMARIAGVLHLAEHVQHRDPWAVPVAASTVTAAVRLAREYLTPHARAAYSTMGDDPVMEDARHVLGWMQERGADRFSKQDVWQGTRGRFERAAQLDAALAVLVERGYVREVPAPERSGPGRKPAPSYELNPLAAPYNSYNPYNAPSQTDSRDSRDSRNHGPDPRLPPEEVEL